MLSSQVVLQHSWIPIKFYLSQDLRCLLCLPAGPFRLLQRDQDQVPADGHLPPQVDSLCLHGGPGDQEAPRQVFYAFYLTFWCHCCSMKNDRAVRVWNWVFYECRVWLLIREIQLVSYPNSIKIFCYKLITIRVIGNILEFPLTGTEAQTNTWLTMDFSVTIRSQPRGGLRLHYSSGNS